MAAVQFIQKNGVGTLVVDGVDISNFTSQVTLTCDGANVPTLNIGVVAWGENDVVLDDAQVAVNGVALPLSVELAMYEHLKKKHGHAEPAVLLDSCSQPEIRSDYLTRRQPQ